MNNTETEQLRIKVAELAGWKFCPKGFKASKEWKSPDGKWKNDIPKLTLDWMHELEKELDPFQRDKYRKELVAVTGDDWCDGKHWCAESCFATAEQRARAYIATMEQTNPKQEDGR